MRLGIRVKLLLFAAVAWTFIFGIYSVHIYHERTEQTRRMALTTATLLSREIIADRQLYSSVIVKKAIDSGLPVKNSIQADEVAIPTPSSFFYEVAAITQSKGGFSMALTSLSPINPANAPRDEFQKKGLDALSMGGEADYHSFETHRGLQSLRYLVPDIATSQTCVDCHNSNPASPKRDYRIGDVMGAVEISMPIEAEMALAISDIWRSIGYGFVIIVAMGLAGLAFVRRIVTGPVFSLAETTDRLSEGDLTAATAVAQDDEIGDLGRGVNEVIGNLHTMIEDIRRASDEALDISERVKEMSKTILDGSSRQGASIDYVSSAMDGINRSVAELGKDAAELAAAVEKGASSSVKLRDGALEAVEDAEAMSRGAVEAAASTGRMTSSIKELHENVEALADSVARVSSAMIRINARIREVDANASEASMAAEEVIRDSKSGMETVDATIRGIMRIKASTLESSALMSDLNDRVKEIGKILDMIMDVAEETNLLAVNAAIIAAQSGEHGKSFSVVAGEIKDLAERTSSSAKEVTEIIRAVEAESGRAAEAMGRGVETVEEGARLAAAAGEDLKKIMESAGRSTGGVRGIARAAAEQARESRMAVDAVESVADMTRKIVGATQEQAAGGDLVNRATERMTATASTVKAAAGAQVEASRRIASAMEEVNMTAAHINGVLREQTRSIQKIVEALAAVRKVSMQNINTAVETDSAVEEMVKLNEELAGGVKRFKLKK